MAAPGCNLACTFCAERQAGVLRRPLPGLSILSGAEPLLEPDLPALIREAIARRDRVILETNGLLFAYEKTFRDLPPPQTWRLRIHLPAPAPEAYNAVTQSPGAFDIWKKAIARLHAKGWPYDLSIPFSAWTEEEDGRLPGFLETLSLKPGQIIAHLRKGDPKALALRLETLAARLPFPIRFAEGHPLPPCVFSSAEMAKTFYEDHAFTANRPSMGEIKHHRCLDCVLDHGCTGLAPGMAPHLETLSPIRRPAVAKNWGMDTVYQSERDENLLTWDWTNTPEGPKPAHALLRVQFQCNHHCRFCWVNPYLKKPDDGEISEAIEKVKKAGVPALTLTGGEPTLHTGLAGIIRSATSAGIEVYLQSHAMRLSDESYARSLQDAGLAFVFASLHGHTATLSDAITGYPGGFEQTVAGIQTLLRLGMPVGISHVLGPENAEYLPEFGRFAAEHLSGATLMLSAAQQVNDALSYRPVTVPFTRLRGPLLTLYQEAPALGLRLAGLSGQCGIVPCVVDGNETLFEDLSPVPPGPHPDFAKPDFCRECRFDSVCWGPRARYITVHGTEGLKPIHGPPPTPRFSGDGQVKRASDLAQHRPAG